MPLTPLEKFAPLALVQIYMPSGSLGLGVPLNVVIVLVTALWINVSRTC